VVVAAVVVVLVGVAATGVRSRGGRPLRAAVEGNVDAQRRTAGFNLAFPQGPTVATTVPSRVPPAVDPAAPPAPADPLDGGGVFGGLGTWVDVFDFDPSHTDGRPTVGPADVDRMASAGVRTLYLQAARSHDPVSPGDLVAPDLLAAFLRRAHARGMAVVAWYLPQLADVADDARHLDAVIGFRSGGERFDGIGLDIEWRAGVPDPGTRSSRLVELSRHLRGAAPGLPVGAIVLPPVVTDVLNTGYWPAFPWVALRDLFDAWLPMSYWTNRGTGSPYRDAYRYTVDNVRMVRDHLGEPAATVHAIGGIGNGATPTDYQRFKAACADTRSVGCSVYDWATTTPAAWALLRG
jgi:hypothetical protein